MELKSRKLVSRRAGEKVSGRHVTTVTVPPKILKSWGKQNDGTVKLLGIEGVGLLVLPGKSPLPAFKDEFEVNLSKIKMILQGLKEEQVSRIWAYSEDTGDRKAYEFLEDIGCVPGKRVNPPELPDRKL
jgi:hypothetical protein